MKKSLLLSIFIIGVLVPQLFAQSNKPFDQIVSDNVIIYVDYDRDNNTLPEYPNFKEAFSNWLQTMEDILEWRLISSEIEAFQNQFNIEEGFSTLLGDKVAFTLSGFDESMTKIPSLLYLSRVDDPQKAQEFLTSLFTSLQKTVPQLLIEADEYRGIPIHSLHSPGMIPGLGLSYSFYEGTLILSTSKPEVVSLFEKFEFNEHPLAADEIYKDITTALPKERMGTIFVNLGNITDTVSNLFAFIPLLSKQNNIDLKENDLVKIKETMEVISVFRGHGIGITSKPDKKTVSLTGFMRVNPDKKGQLSFMNRAPMPFIFETYLPRRTGAFTAGNTFSLKDIWSIVEGVLPTIQTDDGTAANALQNMENDLQISLENDLLSWMDNEWCFLRPVMDLESVVPMNSFAYFIHVKDSAKAQEAMNHFVTSLTKLIPFPLTVESEEYRGETINTVRLPLPVVPVTPSWTIDSNDMLIISSEANLIREMLEIRNGRRPGIVRNPYYRKLQEEFQSEANRFAFQDIEADFYSAREAMRRVASSIQGANSMLQEKTPFQNMMPFVVMDRVSYLLRCLQILKASTKTTRMTPNGTIANKEILMDDLASVPSINPILRVKTAISEDIDWIEEIARWAIKNDPERAIRIYTALAEFYPDQDEYLSTLANLYQQQGETKQAVEAYDNALERMPNSSLLLEREKLREWTTADEIIQRVEKAASQTRRIRAEEVLFQLAIHARDSKESQIAQHLFEHITSEYPSSIYKNVAEKEQNVLLNQPVASVLVPAWADNAPIIDGSAANDTVWNQSHPAITTIKESTPEIQFGIQIAMDEEKIYVLLQGSDPQEGEEIMKEEVRISFDPERSYHTLSLYHLNIYRSEQAEEITKMADIITTSVGNDKRTVQEDTIGADKWNCTYIREKNTWYAEYAIDRSSVRDQLKNRNDYWLLQIQRVIETERGKSSFSISATSEEENIHQKSLQYHWLKILDTQ